MLSVGRSSIVCGIESRATLGRVQSQRVPRQVVKRRQHLSAASRKKTFHVTLLNVWKGLHDWNGWNPGPRLQFVQIVQAV